VAIFGLLPFERFDALVLSFNEPFEDFDALVLSSNGLDGFFEPLAYDLFLLLELMQLFVFAPQGFAQGCLLSSQLFEFFVFGHAATLADCSSFRNCMALLNSY